MSRILTESLFDLELGHSQGRAATSVSLEARAPNKRADYFPRGLLSRRLYTQAVPGQPATVDVALINLVVKP